MTSRALVLCLALTACGTVSNQESSFAQAVASFQQPEFDPRFIALLQDEAPALQFGVPKSDLTGTLLLEHRARGVSHWLSPDGAALTLQDGMLIGTRGFGEGLLTSDPSASLALVRARRAGTADRFHTYLTGDDRAETRTFRCVIHSDGPRQITLASGPTATIQMREDCLSTTHRFSNLYWVQSHTGQIVLSRQWAGPFLGAVSLRVVPQ